MSLNGDRGMNKILNEIEKRRQIIKLTPVIGRLATLFLLRSHTASMCREDDGGSSSGRPVPPGFLPVYIGEERRRFIVPTRFLKFPVFNSLLTMAEEKLGYTTGGIVLPCAVEFFRLVLQLLKKNEAKYKAFSIEDFEELSGTGGIEDLDPLSCEDDDDDDAADDSTNGSSPLLHKV